MLVQRPWLLASLSGRGAAVRVHGLQPRPRGPRMAGYDKKRAPHEFLAYNLSSLCPHLLSTYRCALSRLKRGARKELIGATGHASDSAMTCSLHDQGAYILVSSFRGLSIKLCWGIQDGRLSFLTKSNAPRRTVHSFPLFRTGCRRNPFV